MNCKDFKEFLYNQLFIVIILGPLLGLYFFLSIAFSDEAETYTALISILTLIGSMALGLVLAAVLTVTVLLVVWFRLKALTMKEIPGETSKMSLPTIRERVGRYFDFRRFDRWYRD
ncbi:hypothetical protein [Moorella sp. ACPs]|uniref:hypothetical protein n=1 Tax=Neomoorella carbonis TaxID=3062783 RepID=UPI003250468B